MYKNWTKALLALLLVTLIFPSKGYSNRNNVIKANPMALVLGGINVTYERVTGDKTSLLFSAGYHFNVRGNSATAVGVGAGYRYYFTHSSKELPNGFWLMPEASLAMGSLTEDGTKNNLANIGIGVQAGYQWVLKYGFTIDVGVGPNFSLYTTADKKMKSSLLPALTLAVGFAF